MGENASSVRKPPSLWPLGRDLGAGRDARIAGSLTAQSVAEAISERNSRVVLAACIDAPMSVKDICHATGLPLATAYRQVHRLIDLGILAIERSAMTEEGKKYDLFRSRVAEAYLVVTRAGEDVRWVANEATEGRLHALWDTLRAQARPLEGTPSRDP